MAHTRSYYRTPVDDADEEIRDRALVVNCAGLVASRDAFLSDRPNGRRDIYLLYMAKGGLSMRLGGKRCELSPGDIAIHSPRAPQYYSFSGEGELVYYWAHFTGARSEAILAECGLPMDAKATLRSTEGVAERFQELMGSFILPDQWQEAEAAGHLAILLALLGRAVAESEARPSLARIRNSLNYMHEAYDRQLSVRELAAMEFMSVSRYSAVFRALSGMSPKEYLIRLRMRNAMELLSRTDLSVKEISRSVGYEDPLYFSRLFKKHMGVSPKERRRAKTL